MPSRRRFVSASAKLPFAALAASTPLIAAPPSTPAPPVPSQTVSLCGEWLFRTDPNAPSDQQQLTALPELAAWRTVTVPHTWQIEPPLADYYGVAWYRREFFAAADWEDLFVRIEFEAVFHSARIWINGKLAGEHLRKGYTAFTVDASSFLRFGDRNIITVRVDNAFNEHMLPRGRSSDWAHDGGIYRPVQLLLTPKLFIENVAIDAIPDFAANTAAVNATMRIRNTGSRRESGRVSFQVIDEQTGLPTDATAAASFEAPSGETQSVKLAAELRNPKLWHFDHPNLYRLEAFAAVRPAPHSTSAVFGVRRLEVRDGKFFFNNEPARLMGVERMAGSNPEYGMAEPTEWIDRDHGGLKYLNCMFTRVHWPQDRRVLDYCDRHGILMQSEVPTWGPATFKGMGEQPDTDIMQNGIEQFREMFARDGNHPSIVSWGLCNEIGGQNPPAFNFAKNMLAEAKKLDPNRLCSYASHSLRETPGNDVSRLMDFVECNEYFGSWYPGGAEAVSKSLDEIHNAIPGKPIVISEYGYCACTADRPEGDEHRMEILRAHDSVFRAKPYIGGLIFFCYNDYRTHVGDRGTGVMKQRVHGVVDLYGVQKPSYDLLRFESSPVQSLQVTGSATALAVSFRTRETVPAYTLREYKLRALYYGFGDIPIQRLEIDLPDLAPGQEFRRTLAFLENAPRKLVFDILRPTGFSAYSYEWHP